jgi:hypothetical protein
MAEMKKMFMLYPSLGVGHLIPMVEIAKRIPPRAWRGHRRRQPAWRRGHVGSRGGTSHRRQPGHRDPPHPCSGQPWHCHAPGQAQRRHATAHQPAPPWVPARAPHHRRALARHVLRARAQRRGRARCARPLLFRLRRGGIWPCSSTWRISTPPCRRSGRWGRSSCAAPTCHRSARWTCCLRCTTRRATAPRCSCTSSAASRRALAYWLSVPWGPGTSAYKLQVKTMAPASRLRAAPRPPGVPAAQAPAPDSGQLRGRHVPPWLGTTSGPPCAPVARGSSGATTCPSGSGQLRGHHMSLGLQHPPSGAGQLRSCHVSPGLYGLQANKQISSGDPAIMISIANVAPVSSKPLCDKGCSARSQGVQQAAH